MAEAGIEPSVGRVGNPSDNACAETIIGLYKTEVIRRRDPWHNCILVFLAAFLESSHASSGTSKCCLLDALHGKP